MLLLKLTNLDYIIITILFGAILLITYLARKSNQTSNNLLFYSTKPTIFNLATANLGLLEFLLLGFLGAKLGISSLIIGVISYLISLLIIKIHSFKLQTISSSSLILIIILNLLVLSLSLALMVSLLNNLLAWQFANTTLALCGVFTIIFLIGGAQAIIKNQALAIIINSIIIIVLILISLYKLPNLNLISTFKSIANTQHQTNYYFLIPSFNLANLKLIILITLSLLGFKLLKTQFNTQLYPQKTASNHLELLLVLAFTFSGTLALLTPNKTTLLAGKQIVTEQIRLSDGSLGYLVKAIDGKNPNLNYGITPRMEANHLKYNLFASELNYDFLNSVPSLSTTNFKIASISLVFIILLFLQTITNGILQSLRITIAEFFAKKYNKSGTDLENLWAARVFALCEIAIIIAVGLVLYKFFDLYTGLSLALVLALPVIINYYFSEFNPLTNIIAYLSLITFLSSKLIINPSLISGLSGMNFIYLNLVLTIIYYLVIFILRKLIYEQKK